MVDIGTKLYKVQVLSTNSHHVSFITNEQPSIDFFAILFKNKVGWYIIPNIHLGHTTRLRLARKIKPKKYSGFLENWNFKTL